MKSFNETFLEKSFTTNFFKKKLNKKSFAEKVWNALEKIPKGKISTYREISKSIGKPKAERAVGNACNKNPFSPKVPCHRVIKSDGSLGGFSHGTKKKIALLKKEGIKIKNGKIEGFEKKLFKF